MGKLKEASKQAKTFVMSDDEWNYTKILNYALALNVLKDKIMSGWLHHLARLKWDYPDDVNLAFEVDLNKEDKKEITVKEVSNNEVATVSNQANR